MPPQYINVGRWPLNSMDTFKAARERFLSSSGIFYIQLLFKVCPNAALNFYYPTCNPKFVIWAQLLTHVCKPKTHN